MMALKSAPTPTSSSNHSLHTRTGTAAASPRTESVVSTALERLHQSPYRGLRGVALGVNGNTMVLTGQVRTFFLKQMAQHLLGDYTDAWEIRNEVRVA
ncbi:hypothetical protein Pan44_28840 [Caulifigura coniformis]|uniref:BON domain protein n=1 Tax=Caulifigura coniformis TaxID=2527983 RepID=A0A517SFE2_9PLAN|nr:hypothetical protein [Caulifigura coniformis]QDT54846.1 hypothetical protein Pan44_28840 [Caulifigura coniformis]